MIIYESLKHEFMKDVEEGVLITKLYTNYQNIVGRTSKSEIKSWQNSLKNMYVVLNDDKIPDTSGIAIEYRIPTNSKRIDFIISGRDQMRANAVVVELKQWDEIEAVTDRDGIVKTLLGGGFQHTTHPSYQVSSYVDLINDFNESVQRDQIQLHPCAFLHNYYIQPENDPLISPIYQEYVEKAPIFDATGSAALRQFIKKFIKYGDNKEVLYAIEHGRIRPSKSLQDALSGMLDGNPEFIMIDEQKVVYEQAVVMATLASRHPEKQVLIVKGGPGTGKSVLAVQLLGKLTAKGLLCHYVTKNTAPREVYAAKLKGNGKRHSVDNLFKSSGIYYDMNENELDVVLVDEAHRLNEKSGLFSHLGENQMKELINSSKCSVFFIDEAQKIHFKDAGKIATIRAFAEKMGAEVHEMELLSQFRCNGSDGYMAFLDDVLEIKETANGDGFDLDYDLQVMDSPHQVFNKILEKNSNNKARLLAGYCWDWIGDSKNDPNSHDIVIKKHDFAMSWNLGNTKTYAIDTNSVNQVGCIHTSQGLELEYVGVIIGKDLRLEKGHVITDYTKRAKTDQSIKGIKGMMKVNPEKAKRIADEIIKNTYRVLMTRGQKGCYIYCEDEALAGYLKLRIDRAKKFKDGFGYGEVERRVMKFAEDKGTI